ncbi:hypothetical protein RDWZM_000738 [Blomia tropicalis]|uniref:E2F/DP family winged-helix DNA-binding domain-containing protein n=1 Tax=Blomia tropicalis TaxID=40697 RepID=A0A9Q0MBI6_BLOTA|nr:hypothetical protein RDWZM_000738 [Blomia tropicalis]
MATSSKASSKIGAANHQMFHLNNYDKTPDHIYLAPAFYNSLNEYESVDRRSIDNNKHHIDGDHDNNQLSVTTKNYSSNIRKVQMRPSILLKTNTTLSTSSSTNYKLKPSSEQCEESLSSCSDMWFDMEEMDEDSNDTRSCSSSSGCSSSSNSMVGSVNRHLSLNSQQQYYHRTSISTTTTASGKNGTLISPSSSLSQYKDLTPKQVKRRLDWDSTPESPLISKTMTAVNGKPLSVRTFKLSNAMKQSLVASGCSNSVAVAAVAAAFKNNGNATHDKLLTVAQTPASNGSAVMSPVVTHQSPTIAIVNGLSSKSTTPVHTIAAAPTNGIITPSKSTQPQVIFKTPLTPKSSTSVSTPNQHQIFVVNGKGSEMTGSTNKQNGIRFNATNGTHLTPILANTTTTTILNGTNNTTNGTSTATTNGNKRMRTNNTTTNGNGNKTPKAKSSRSRSNSFGSDIDNSGIFSSPFSFNDLSSSNLIYGSNSSGGSSPSSSNDCTSFSTSSSRKPGRYETSLGQLTRKFINLLETSPDGSINLNDASDMLKVQKRRIYDITNVLEGVGLLHKTSKNNIQWRGGLFDYCAGRESYDNEFNNHYRNRKPPPLTLLFNESSSGLDEIHDRVRSRSELEMELSELENDENRLDGLLEVAQEDLCRLKLNNPKLYVNYMDLRYVPEFTNQTVIGIRPPSDTTLEVPDPSESLQIRLKNSNSQKIEVYLCPQLSEEDDTHQTNPFHKTEVFNGTNAKAYVSNLGKSPMKAYNNNSRMNVPHSMADGDDNSSEIIPTELSSSSSSDLRHENMVVKSEFESGYNSYFSSSMLSTTTCTPNRNLAPMNGENANSGISYHKELAMSSEHGYEPTSDGGLGLDHSLLSASSAYDDFGNRSVSQANVQFNPYAHAFISEDDVFGPLGSRNFLAQTEDQIAKSSGSSPTSHQHNHHQTPFSPMSFVSSLIPLEPPVTEDDYNFTLCENEGIAELFDDEFLNI